MFDNTKRNFKLFSLVELIVVLSIIVFLGTTAFLILTHWMSKSRDVRKITDLSNIEKIINLSYTNNNKLPIPDDYINIVFSGEVIWQLGYFGNSAIEQAGSNVTKLPIDPTTKERYKYAQRNNEKFQLGTLVENIKYTTLYNNTYGSEYYSKLQGTYNQSIISVRINQVDNILPVPSLIINNLTGQEYSIDSGSNYLINKHKYDSNFYFQSNPIYTGKVDELKDRYKFSLLKSSFVAVYSGVLDLKDEDHIDDYILEQIEISTNKEIVLEYETCDGIANGRTKVFYTTGSVEYGQDCNVFGKEFQCVDGIWMDGENPIDKNIYKYSGCEVLPQVNCDVSTKILNGHTYNLPFMTNGEEKVIISQPIAIDNGIIKFTQSFKCDFTIVQTLGEESQNPIECDRGAIVQDEQCIMYYIWSGDNNQGFVFSEGGVTKYPKSCNDLIVSSSPDFKLGTENVYNGSKFEDGIYRIKPNSNPEYQVYCDMTNDGGGWTFLVSIPGNSQIFADRTTTGIWKSPLFNTEKPGLPSDNIEYLSKAYSDVYTNNIKLCYENNTKCYSFGHNMNIPFYNFFRDNLSFVDYSYDLVGYGNQGSIDKRTEYFNKLGHSTSLFGYCYFLGINYRINNLTNTELVIGFGGDSDGACISRNNYATSRIDNYILGVAGFHWPYTHLLYDESNPDYRPAGVSTYNITNSTPVSINTSTVGIQTSFWTNNWFIMGK